MGWELKGVTGNFCLFCRLDHHSPALQFGFPGPWLTLPLYSMLNVSSKSCSRWSETQQASLLVSKMQWTFSCPNTMRVFWLIKVRDIRHRQTVDEMPGLGQVANSLAAIAGASCSSLMSSPQVSLFCHWLRDGRETAEPSANGSGRVQMVI